MKNLARLSIHNYLIIALILYFLPVFIILFFPGLLIVKLKSLDLPFVNVGLSLTNNLLSKIIIIIIISYSISSLLRHINKDKIFNDNGLVYLNFYCFFIRISAYLSGYRKISAINMPIWMQFKLGGQTSWNLITDDLNEVNDEDIEVKFISGKSNDKVINLYLSDTYSLNGKIPECFYKHDSYYIGRSEQGFKSYSEQFLKEIYITIGNIYHMGYVRVNIFASTNPQHTIKIAKELSRRKRRERKTIQFFVYQSCGDDHMYVEEHKVIN